jgi:galactokinase
LNLGLLLIYSPRPFSLPTFYLLSVPSSAFARNDHSALSTLVARSHSLTCTHLRNTVPETEWLPPAGIELGAIAASAFGAGFGGSCWAVAPAERAAEIADRWSQLYIERFPEREQGAKFFVMAPGPGACAV